MWLVFYPIFRDPAVKSDRGQIFQISLGVLMMGLRFIYLFIYLFILIRGLKVFKWGYRGTNYGLAL